MIETATPPAFSSDVARAIVRKIHSNVGAMIGPNSKVIEGDWTVKNDAFGLFDKSELQLGRLVGTGGFSDVYEVVGFKATEAINRRYGGHQVAARCFYEGEATNHNRDGTSKYVVKQLRSRLMQDPNKFCLAAADLCVEAQFLSSLSHKNILKIRGWSTGGTQAYANGSHDAYFLILDRLSETLGERIEKWQAAEAAAADNTVFDLGLRRSQLSIDCDYDGGAAQLLSRTKVARQIASALEYLHGKNIVFRDLKPNNVGFDEHGTVKIFDFGLARELPKECTNVNDVYTMSGKIGTVRFMAPEVALSKEYNQKVDTYSWAMLFWNCLTLDKPYAEMGRSVHLHLVCRLGQRPKLWCSWPSSIQRLLERAWAQDMYTRLTMTEVSAYLERIERELTGKMDCRRSSSVIARPSLTRETSITLVSMAA